MILVLFSRVFKNDEVWVWRRNSQMKIYIVRHAGTRFQSIRLVQYSNKIKKVYNSNEILQRSQEEAKLMVGTASPIN